MARISMKTFLEQDGRDLMEILQEASDEGVCPALCDEDCTVEPDGHCEHGCPSVMLAAGMI